MWVFLFGVYRKTHIWTNQMSQFLLCLMPKQLDLIGLNNFYIFVLTYPRVIPNFDCALSSGVL